MDKRVLTQEEAEAAIVDLREKTHRLDKRVLVLAVDDDQNDLFMLVEMLKHFTNFDVHQASNADEAVRMIRADRYEIVFLDLRMPGIGGRGVLREVGAMSRFIVVTGLEPTAPEIAEAIRLGAVTFITKPVTLEKLRAILS